MPRCRFALWLGLATLQAACATSIGQHPGSAVNDLLACRPSPVEPADAPRTHPSRDEVLDQLMRVAPHVAACSRGSVRDRIVTTKFYIAGATGLVTQVAVQSVPDEVAQCITAQFGGVCFVPFETPTFSVTFPFKSR